MINDHTIIVPAFTGLLNKLRRRRNEILKSLSQTFKTENAQSKVYGICANN